MELSLPIARGALRRKPRPTSSERALLRLSQYRLSLRLAVGALAALTLLGGGWLWLRNSSLVAVRHVHITGVHGPDALEIREALDSAARHMTTTNFNLGALRSAVASYALVAGLRATANFPHTVSIAVQERPPVAALVVAGQRTAVAADGTVLGSALLSNSLPTVAGSSEPAIGASVSEPATLAAVAVLGSAPKSLVRFVAHIYKSAEGLTVAMRNGLLVYFGDATRPHAKWLSLTRVLVSPSAAGALYVDVRLPERPAAGFSSSPTSSASTNASPVYSTATSASSPTTNPTEAALAANLTNTVGGPAAATSSSSERESAKSSGEESATAESTAASTSESNSSETPISPPTETSSSPIP